MNKKLNTKAFTLIEILAVVVILGVLMTIGVVSITKYISGSKKDAFIQLARTYVKQARNEITLEKYSVNTHKSLTSSQTANLKCGFPPKDSYTAIPLDIIGIENKNQKSPYEAKIKLGFVYIVNINEEYIYYVSLYDSSNHGISEPTSEANFSRKVINSLNNTKVNVIKTQQQKINSKSAQQFKDASGVNRTINFYELCK